MELDNILQFGAADESPLSLFVVGAAYNTSSRYVSLKSYSYKTFSFTSPDERIPIRITLAYTDYPGTAATSGSSSVMVNKLTLSAKSSSGTKYVPSSSTSNLQVIDIAASSANTVYTVNVSAAALSYTQPFSLVIRGQ